MQIGDPIKVTGKVKDIVQNSVLMQSDDLPGAPGREFWFPEAQVQSNAPVVPEGATTTTTA